MNKPTPHNKSQLEYYDKEGESYDQARGLNRLAERKANIIRSCLLELTPLKKILEIGCGSGLVTYYLVQNFSGEYVALDLSPEMIKIAQNRIAAANINYVVGDAATSDFAEQSFDAIIGVDVIHHLEDPVGAFKQWKKLVRPNGKMIFLETNIYNPINIKNIGVEHEVRSFLNTDTNLKKWSKLAGWEAVSVTPAPAYTPSVPKCLAWLYDLIDRGCVKIPLLNKITALWLINNTKK